MHLWSVSFDYLTAFAIKFTIFLPLKQICNQVTLYALALFCRYFFKRDSNEFGEGAVFEEIDDDNAVLPMWDGKVVAKLAKVE